MHGKSLFFLFVDRPVLTLMVTLAVLLVGVVSFGKLPLRFAPEGLEENQINIWIPVPQGRSPEEVEDKVTIPFEEQLRTIPGIREVRSDSDDDSAVLYVTLDEGMDNTLAAAEVRDRAARARLEWPDEVDRYFSWREDASSVPLAFFQMLTPARNPDWDFLIDKVVKPRLEAIDGVGRVDVWGLLQETIRIWFDREKMVAHRVDYFDLIQRLSADNFARPVGELEDGEQRFLLRVDNKFDNLAEIRNYPIRTGLVLSDIARVERVPSIVNSLSRFNQKYTYSGMVHGASGANPVDASERLRAASKALNDDPRLADLEFRFLFDQGAMISDSLETLLTTSLQGGLLALVALFLFLRNIRFTIAIALAIPLALLIVGGWLFFTDDSLNILTMAGMTLAVGMVVDNSVVVLENIRRLREKGLPLREACTQGAREVGLAVSMATLTTVVVILPMVLMGSGQARVLLSSVGVPLSVALVGSLLVALLLLPSGLRHVGGMGKHGVDNGGKARVIDERFSPVAWLMRFNQWLLAIALRHRVVASLTALGCLATCQIPQSLMDFADGGGGIFRRGDVAIHMKLPRGLDLGEVEREVIAYEDFVLEHKEEWKVDTVSSRFSRRTASIDIGLHEEVAKESFDEYRDKIEQAWPRRPGVEVQLRDRSGQTSGGGSEEKEERSFVLRLYGRDSQFLMDLAQRVRDDVARLPETDKVEIPQLDDTQEVVVEVDRDRIQELGVRPEVLQGMMSSGLQGRMLTEFEEEGRETPLIAEYDSERNPNMQDLRQTQIWADSGAFQDLSSMSTIRYQQSLGAIERTDGRTHVTIAGRRAPGTGPVALSEALSTVMRRFPLPRGYAWSEESMFRDTQAQMDDLSNAGLLGVVLVFLLMGVLFESVLLPFSIVLFLVPFSTLGAMWSLYLFYGKLDAMAYVGMILLGGIVVNNGIVLLDCIWRLRKDGLSRDEAIMEGTRRRLRPIVMTAVTTITGLLPMALFGESTGQGLSYVSLSITVAGGLALCTIFTAFVVPLTYSLMDDLLLWGRNVWRRAVPARRVALLAD